VSEKRTYDVAFSIGGTCRCSMALREGGLQYHSFPFDWTGGPTANQKVELLCRDFEGWMLRENLVQVVENRFDHSSYWQDAKLGYVYVHDFDSKTPFEEQYPVVRNRLLNRARRLADLIAHARRVLVSFVEAPEFERETEETLLQARAKLMARWPGVEFDMLFVQHEDGVGVRRARTTEREGLRHAWFDYRDRRERSGQWMVDHVQVGKWLRRDYAVRDYRTPEERAHWKERQKKATLARFAATGWVDYCLTKMRYKLYVHLRKRLAEKGLV